jgi:hypothetical protein
MVDNRFGQDFFNGKKIIDGMDGIARRLMSHPSLLTGDRVLPRNCTDFEDRYITNEVVEDFMQRSGVEYTMLSGASAMVTELGVQVKTNICNQL